MASDRKSERKKRNQKVSAKIRILKKEGKPQRQAVAIAINTVKRGRRGR